MHTFREVIDQWGAIDDLAADIGRKPDTVRKWRQRDRIPSAYWLALLASARRRKIAVTQSLLIRLAARDS